MEDSILCSHINQGKWFKIKCCYCDTDQSIYNTQKRHHGTMRGVAPNSRLKQTTEFIKDHYADIRYKLEQQIKDRQSGYWQYRALNEPDIPNCAKLRQENPIDKPFKIINENDNEYNYNPKDKEFRDQLKKIRSMLKPIKF